MAKQRKCIVCGMPLQKKSDYPSGDTSKDYCKYCGDKEGLHPYEKLVEGMAKFIVKTQGMEKEEAMKAARKIIDNCDAMKTGRIKKE